MRESMLLLMFILLCTCRAEESTIGTTISNVTDTTAIDTTTILSTTACSANSSCTTEPTVGGKNNGTVGTSTTAVPEPSTTTTVRPKPVRRKEVIAETCTCDLQVSTQMNV